MKARITKHVQLEVKTFTKLIEISKKLGITQTKVMEDALSAYFYEIENVDKSKKRELW